MSLCIFQSVMAAWFIGAIHYHSPLARIATLFLPCLFLDQVCVQSPRDWKEIVTCSRENSTSRIICIDWYPIKHSPNLWDRCVYLINLYGTFCERSNYLYALFFQIAAQPASLNFSLSRVRNIQSLLGNKDLELGVDSWIFPCNIFHKEGIRTNVILVSYTATYCCWY